MYKIIWVLVFSIIQTYNAMYLEPEELIVSYFNKKYVNNAFIELTRYGPGGISWFITIGGDVMQQWGNNVTVHFKFYEYVNNEYRPSFIDVKFRLCDLINKEAYVGGMLRRNGLVCPVPVAAYKLSNMTIKSVNNDWPFEKCRLTCELSVTGTKEIFLKGSGIISFKKENDKKKKRH